MRKSYKTKYQNVLGSTPSSDIPIKAKPLYFFLPFSVLSKVSAPFLQHLIDSSLARPSLEVFSPPPPFRLIHLLCNVSSAPLQFILSPFLPTPYHLSCPRIPLPLPFILPFISPFFFYYVLTFTRFPQAESSNFFLCHLL